MERNRGIKFLLSALMTFFSQIVFAQDTVEMADTMRSNGKIYVVIAVIAIVITVLFVYLISIDKKVKKLEDKLNKK
jgi:CcmD family protein